MPEYLACPYLGEPVELNDERVRHVHESHLAGDQDVGARLAVTLRDPDIILRSGRPNERAFARREDTGRHLVVIVISDPVPSGRVPYRHWVVTAYAARRLPRWRIEWQRG